MATPGRETSLGLFTVGPYVAETLTVVASMGHVGFGRDDGV
jgi:hypothetical protein